MSGEREASSWVLPVLRLLVLIGLGVSGYLVYLSVAGGGAAGCAEGEAGCDAILRSAWSAVFGVPVAGLAGAAYLVLLFASVHASEKATPSQQKGAWRVMALIGVAAGTSALWFIGVQVVRFESLCPYCMAVHGCSLGIAGLAVWRVRGWVPWLGVVPAGLLIAVQLLFPTAPSLDRDLRGTPIAGIELDRGPVVGDPDAPSQIVLLYDYNCSHCRRLHAGVERVLERYEGRLSIRMLPTALDPACNRSVAKANPNSATSCELARLALAVWLAEPGAFAAFDRHVIQSVGAKSAYDSDDIFMQEMRGFAAHLVGQAELDRAMQDPWMKKQLDLAASLYGKATDPATGKRGLPRVVVAGHAYAGITDPALLLELVGEKLEGDSE